MSMPSLAISGDLSDLEEEEPDLPRTKRAEHASSLSSSNSSLTYTARSPSVASASICVVEKLSWCRTIFQLPLLAMITLGVLPLIQGCLYTIGYRYGRRFLQHYIK